MATLPYITNNFSRPKDRIITTIFIILGIFFMLFFRLWYLQAVKGKEYRIQSEGNRNRLRRLKSPRGIIMDRYKQTLAQNRPSFTVSIVPEDVKDMEKILAVLSGFIDRPLEQIKKTIDCARSLPFEPIPLKSDLSFKEVALLEEHSYDLPGVTVEVEAKRYYPHQGLAAHLLGYMGEISPKQLKMEGFQSARPGDMIGQSGIEKVANSYLMGKDGGKHVEVNAEGREIRTIGYLAPLPGNNISLTIDLNLQKKAEEALGEKCGAIVAMDPQNGKILAMVSHPSFNPDQFAIGITQMEWNEMLKNPKDPLQNRIIMAHYPPGSIFKIVVASAGLQTRLIDQWSTFYCPGSINLGSWTYYCWKKGGHGDLSVHEAIVQSCNCFFYQLGSKLGIDVIAQFARDYGFGSLTGIILPGENQGLIPDSVWKKRNIGASWYPGETITASIGQGYILVTPIQLACFISAIANGGILYQPSVIESIETPNGNTVEKFLPSVKSCIPIRPEKMRIIREALKGVVNENGTGWRARIPDIVVSGKTGTAQVVKKRHDEDEDVTGSEDNIPEHLRDHAWFVAFAPYDEPKIAVVVLVEHGGHGGYSSAPIAKEVIQAYLQEEVLQ
ncbi:penicillin-binding protein 2 [bacterium]|nr:penicillin-binding protein 2 [bacterium]